MRRNRVGWVLWVAGALAIYLFENRGATLALLLASVLVPLASVAGAVATAERCRVRLELPERAVQGETLPGTLTVVGLVPLAAAAGHLNCRNPLTGEEKRVPVSLAPGAPLTFRLEMKHCGTVHVEAVLQVRDWFGLWRSPSLPAPEVRVRVEPVLCAPGVFLAESSSPLTEGNRYSSTHAGADPGETFDIREYRPGDPIRQIHWKLSSKTETMMLRELGAPVVDRLLLLLETSRPAAMGPEVSDACARVFLSLSRCLAEEGILHTLGWSGKAGGPETLEVGDLNAWGEAENRVLDLECLPETGNVAGCFADRCAQADHAHVAVVAPALPDGAERLSRSGRITVLTADTPSFAPGGLWLHPFPVPGFEEALEQVTL